MTSLTSTQTTTPATISKQPAALSLYKQTGEIGEKAIATLSKDDAITIRLNEPIVAGQNNPKISELAIDDLTSVAAELVNIFTRLTWFKSSFGTGEEAKENRMAFVTTLATELYRECQHYRVFELEEAVRRGAHKKYITDNGVDNLSPVNIIRWVAEYRKERMTAIGKLQQEVDKLTAEAAPKLPPANPLPERARSIYAHRCKCDKEGGRYTDFGMMNMFASIGYEFIETTGIFQVSSQDKISAMDWALEDAYQAQIGLRLKGRINPNDTKHHAAYLSAYKAAKNDSTQSLYKAMKEQAPEMQQNPIFKAATYSAKRKIFEWKIMSVSADRLRELLNDALSKNGYELIPETL